MSEETKKPEEMTTHTEAAPAGEPTAADDAEKARRAAERAARDAARAERAAARAAAKAAAEGGAATPSTPAAGADAPAAKAAGGNDGEAAPPPKAPSPNQPKLDRLVEIIKEHVGEAAVTDAYINERDRHLPTIIVDKAYWTQTALLLRDHPELKLHFLRNMTGVDYETYLEVDYFLINYQIKQTYCVKVKTDRDHAELPSVQPIWETANWNEREIYDLLGITFTGHPNLKRIMLADDWVGHPLRKDYVPIDSEV